MLNEVELVTIKGGAAIKYIIGLGIGAVVTFVFGILDGYMRPLKCN